MTSCRVFYHRVVFDGHDRFWMVASRGQLTTSTVSLDDAVRSCAAKVMECEFGEIGEVKQIKDGDEFFVTRKEAEA